MKTKHTKNKDFQHIYQKKYFLFVKFVNIKKVQNNVK